MHPGGAHVKCQRVPASIAPCALAGLFALLKRFAEALHTPAAVVPNEALAPASAGLGCRVFRVLMLLHGWSWPGAQ